MIHMMARITARPECAADLKRVLGDLVAPTRREAGCIGYDLFQNADHPVEFVTVERWRDAAAADAHMRTPHVSAAIGKAGPLLAAPPAIHRFTPVE